MNLNLESRINCLYFDKMKTKLAFLYFFLFTSFQVFAQFDLIENQSIKYNAGRSIFYYDTTQGLIHMSNSDDGYLQLSVYNENLEKKGTYTANYKVINSDFVDCVADGNDLHFFFLDNNYIGFKNSGTLFDIVLSNKKLNVQKYKFPGAINIAEITIENGKTTIYGGELYKKWDALRVIKFGISPLFFGLPLLFPKSPTTRPLIAELENGKVKLINRKMYKDRHYKNKLIHVVHSNEDGSKWLAITNGIKPGKKPVFLEKYTEDNKLLKSNIYTSNKNSRISLFQFNDTLTNADSAAFTVGFGKNVLAGPFLQRGGIQSLTGLYEGVYFDDENNRTVLTPNNEDLEFKTANDPFSRDVPSSIEKKFTASKNDTLYKIHMICYLLPLEESNGKTTTIIGYYFTPPYVTVTNTITNRSLYYQLSNPDPNGGKNIKKSKAAKNAEAQRIAMQGHFCYKDYLTYDLFQASIVQDSQQFYIVYVDPQGSVTCYEPGNESNSLNEIYNETVKNKLKKVSGHGSSYRLIRIADDKIMVLVTSVPKASLITHQGKANTDLQIYEFIQP